MYQGAPTTRFGFKNVKQKHRNLARYLDVDYVAFFLKLCIGECPSNSPFLKNNGAEAHCF